jgi:hypothetical protein
MLAIMFLLNGAETDRQDLIKGGDNHVVFHTFKSIKFLYYLLLSCFWSQKTAL